ncbi:radical SAM protein [Uliginosibacterium sp. TH139]|uniref:radical SAM protein n=1 Tax=Uliginosibacterium sp. TH139 TaxID=2067453 RepID=UPI000C7C3C4F|nr:radical SAM protein [Uliginosibacterium sp. TH139]PLK50646.1 hypothetical protein C0V76_02200 [Uliginosibacterium sp. TH139]
MMNQARRVIVWRVTQDCNLDCQFCSYSQSLERIRQNADPAKVLRLGRILNEYSRQTGREVLVSWIGGEPLLWPSLLDVSSRFVHDFGLSVSATTNGVPLRSEKVIERIVDDFAEIVISIDGFGGENDRVRQKPGLFEELKRNVSALCELKEKRGSALIVKVNTILMRNNIDEFGTFCELMRDWGVNELTFNQLGGYDRPEFFPDNRLLVTQVARFIDALPGWKNDFSEAGLRIHGNDAYLKRFQYSCRDEKIPVEDCAPGAWFWFVNENGLISPCSYTSYEYAIDVDAISSPEELDAVEQSFRQMRRDKRSRFCADCHCTQLFDKFA